MTEDLDGTWYKILLDESSDFALSTLQRFFSFNDKWPKIDKQEVVWCFDKVVELFKFNSAPITPKLLEIEREAQALEKVVETIRHAFTD